MFLSVLCLFQDSTGDKELHCAFHCLYTLYMVGSMAVSLDLEIVAMMEHFLLIHLGNVPGSILIRIVALATLPPWKITHQAREEQSFKASHPQYLLNGGL